MKYAALGIILILMVTGCSQNTETSFKGDGLSIQYFQASDYSVDEGDSVDFTLDVMNTGGTTARYIKAELTGVEGSWYDAYDYLIGTSPYQIPKYYWSLDPSEKNKPGESFQTQWNLRTPSLGEGITQDFDVTAKVSYDYRTSASIRVKAYSKKQLQIMENKGETAIDPIQVTTSDSPIQVEFIDGEYPIEIDVNRPYERSVFRFNIKNVGNGFPITYGENGLISGRVSVWGPGVYIIDCMGIDASDVRNFYNMNYIDLEKDYWFPGLFDFWECAYDSCSSSSYVTQTANGWSIDWDRERFSTTLFFDPYWQYRYGTMPEGWWDYPTMFPFGPFLSQTNSAWLKLNQNGETPVTCTIGFNQDEWLDKSGPETVRFDFDLIYRYYVKDTQTVSVTGQKYI